MRNYTEAAAQALEHSMIRLVSEKHAGHVYGAARPYTYHLRAVRDNVLRFLPYIPYGWNVNIMVLGAWGHDLIEDTDVTKEYLEQTFGVEVSDLIWFVTDEPGANRKERHIATYQKTRLSSGAVFLKLCDRIANIEAGGKTDMYRREHLDFKAALYKEGEFDVLWDHLDLILKKGE